jgi:hypothetical protein
VPEHERVRQSGVADRPLGPPVQVGPADPDRRDPHQDLARVRAGHRRRFLADPDVALLPSFGFNQTTQWDCLYNLWTRESGWNVYAENPATGAYGIPQAFPGNKMASAGADWQTDPTTQIRWGLGYIAAMYGTPCGAWDNELATGSY